MKEIKTKIGTIEDELAGMTPEQMTKTLIRYYEYCVNLQDERKTLQESLDKASTKVEDYRVILKLLAAGYFEGDTIAYEVIEDAATQARDALKKT